MTLRSHSVTTPGHSTQCASPLPSACQPSACFPARGSAGPRWPPRGSAFPAAAGTRLQPAAPPGPLPASSSATQRTQKSPQPHPQVCQLWGKRDRGAAIFPPVFRTTRRLLVLLSGMDYFKELSAIPFTPIHHLPVSICSLSCLPVISLPSLHLPSLAVLVCLSTYQFCPHFVAHILIFPVSHLSSLPQSNLWT